MDDHGSKNLQNAETANTVTHMGWVGGRCLMTRHWNPREVSRWGPTPVKHPRSEISCWFEYWTRKVVPFSKRFVLLWQVTVQNFTITKLLFSSSGLLHAFACKCAGVGLKTVAWCSMLFFDVLRAFLVSFCWSVPPEFLLSFLASPDALEVMWVSD